jgi:hypothetical protein
VLASLKVQLFELALPMKKARNAGLFMLIRGV